MANEAKQKSKTIDDYHKAQPEGVRQILETLHQAIKQVVPNAEETISYGMPAFRIRGEILVYYAAYKRHIGFYPTSSPIIFFKEELSRFKTSKGAIQFPLTGELPLELIKKIVQYRIDEILCKQDNEVQILDGILHTVPKDMKKALAEDPAILDIWNKLTPIQRNEWICWVTSVKKEETRSKHIKRMISELQDGKKIPCCWPGCPHRKPNSKKWVKR
jgi:uncharacterized protein YdhG (YjbR/CyaY superfamily)